MGWFTKWKPEIEREISSTALYRRLKKMFPEANYIHSSDKYYRIPADPADVMWMMGLQGNFVYRKQVSDCDDATRIFRGKMSSKGHGNVLAMDCIITKLDGARHAVISFLKDDALSFGEPQTGRMIQYEVKSVDRLIA